MAITRAEIKYNIYEKLNKTAVTRGFYTEPKANAAIQEAIDFIGTQMQLADDGWSHKLDYIDVSDGTVTIPIQPHMSMIVDVRFLSGDVYIPIGYDQRFGDVAYSQQSGAVQFPSRYSVIDNSFYFNPAISVGGAKALEVQYMAYPKRLLKDADTLESQFDRAMFWYIIYKSCSILSANISQFSRPWANEENMWAAAVNNVVFKRNQQMVPIREFEG